MINHCARQPVNVSTLIRLKATESKTFYNLTLPMKTNLDNNKVLNNVKTERTPMNCNRKGRLTSQQEDLYLFNEETPFNQRYRPNPQLLRAKELHINSKTRFPN